MFTFKRPKVVNQLTTLINKNPDGTTVKEVLSNQDLSPSIRNEVPELLDFFCPPLPNPPSPERAASSADANKSKEERQKVLALLAFTSKLNREGEEYNDDVTFRFNRNASNIISSPSKKFHDRLVYYYSDGSGKYTPSPFLKQLIKFAKSLKGQVSVHHQPVFYGHFHRIFEAIVRSTKGQFFECIYKVAPDLDPFYKVLIDRIFFTSIRQLYITCSSEYPQQFAGLDNQDPTTVFRELSKYGATESNKIHGKKKKTVKKIYMKQKEWNEYENKTKNDKDYCVTQFDQVGFKKKVKYIQKGQPHEETEKKKEKVDESGKTTKKKSRVDHYQNVVASLLAIRDILNDSTEVVQNFRNKEIIKDILIIGKNAPESSFTVSLAYNLILRIATSDKKSLNDFRDILDQNDYIPKYEDIPNLRKRIEKSKHEDDQDESSGEHLIYQMPLYFLNLPKDFQDLFFSHKKYSDKFDDQFVFTIKSVLTKKEQIEFFTRDDNYFLKGLCSALPEPPKLNLAEYSKEPDDVDPEFPSIIVTNLQVDDDSLPKSREPLYGHLWDIAKYIDDDKRFKKEDVSFKNGQEWDQLHNKVDEYYKRVYAYTKEPVDEEEEDYQEQSE